MTHANWQIYLIEGHHYQRLIFKGLVKGQDSCYACGANKGKFHALGCKEEDCPHCDKKAIECEAEGYVGSD